MATAKSKSTSKPEPETASEASEPDLDLTLAPTRPYVRVPDPDSETGTRVCELKLLSDFGLRQQQELHRDGKEFQQLWETDVELDDAQHDRMKLLLDRMFDLVIDAPKKIKDGLSDAQRAQVVLRFRIGPSDGPMAQQIARMLMSEVMAGSGSS